MIKYICEKCNEIECETSICPVCENRTKIKETKVFWCEHCNIPLYEEKCSCCGALGSFVGTDIRPVFPEERLLLELIEDEPFKYAEKSVWNVTGNHYIVNGKKIKFSVKNTIETTPAKKIIEGIQKYKEENKKYEENFLETEYIQKFIKANNIRLNTIMTEAIQYIQENAKHFQDDEMFVSFSGGKDSTVVSSLVMKALGREDIIHIYGDTTLEYPTTEVYLKRFRNEHRQTPMLVAKNKEQDFNELCKVIGPPSRVMRWCCTIFKTGAITRKIDATFRSKNKILTFQGIRRNESAARSKYDRESTDSKIAKQLVIAPIIDWLDFDIWLYLLSNKVDFNDAYRQGFARVGCWCCPNNSTWSEYLSSIYMEGQYNVFHEILIDFAKQVGKPDPEEYISSGGWKARQGGNGLDFSKNAVIEFKPCVLAENTYNFELNKDIDDKLYEFFKPFGILNFTLGNPRLNEVYVLERKTNEPLLKLTGRKQQKTLKVTILKQNRIFKDEKTAEMLIKNQITKYQTCIGCLACESQCKFNAIKITDIGVGKSNNYYIDEKKCVGCLNCVKHFQGGCFMKKVLRTKKEI